MKTALPQVSDNNEKSQAYKFQLARYKQAARMGFYYEGIFILYAMLEDRLSSFLYYAGVTNNTREMFTRNKMVRPDLDNILSLEGKKQYRLRKISQKISIINQIFTWLKTYSPAGSSNSYKESLAAQITKTTGVENIAAVLNEILSWCNSRNELIHALMNKKPENLELTLSKMTEEGYAYCRQLDNFVRAFKTRNAIRKQFNIQ